MTTLRLSFCRLRVLEFSAYLRFTFWNRLQMKNYDSFYFSSIISASFSKYLSSEIEESRFINQSSLPYCSDPGRLHISCNMLTCVLGSGKPRVFIITLTSALFIPLTSLIFLARISAFASVAIGDLKYNKFTIISLLFYYLSLLWLTISVSEI